MRAVIEPQIDLKIKARKNIQARQFCFSVQDDASPMGSMDNKTLVEHINRALCEGREIYRAMKGQEGDIMIETDTDETENWLKDAGNLKQFKTNLGLVGDLKPHNHGLIAFYIPTTFDPNNAKHIEEICETNNLEKETITKARWIKPIK